jgi:Tfp pilus assembly protein PilN
MKTSINLALGTQVINKKSYVRYVYWMFAVVFCVAMIMIVTTITLKLQFTDLESEERELITAINSQPEKKFKMLIVSERVKSIQSLYSRRGDLNVKLSELVAIFPPSITIDSLNAQNSQFTLSLRTTDLSEMNTVLEEDLPEFTKDNPGLKIVDISSFKASDGEYTLELRFEFKGGLASE